MTLSVQNFYNQLSEEINQGTRLDTYLPRYVRRAVRQLERNYSLLYMERFSGVDLDVDAANARFLPWPSELTKKINFVRYAASTDGTVTTAQNSNARGWVYLQRCDPINVTSIETASPQAYWLTGGEDGLGYLVLDQVGTTDITFEIHWVQYTDWDSLLTTATHWLLNNAEDVLIAQTLQLLAGLADEPDWIPKYTKMRDEGIRTLLMADEEFRSSGEATGFAMVYK